MSDKSWSYCLPDYGDPYPDGAKQITDDSPWLSHEARAELAAEQEHYGGIGLDCDWPVRIELFKDGHSMGICEVERRAEPVFIARKEKK